MYRALNCEKSPILELLGDDSQVTMDNVMLYLDIIEKEVSNMISKIFWVDKTTKSEERICEENRPTLVPPSLSDVVPTQPCPL